MQNVHKAVVLSRGRWDQGKVQSLVGHQRTVIAARCNPKMFLQGPPAQASPSNLVALGDMSGQVSMNSLGCPASLPSPWLNQGCAALQAMQVGSEMP